MANKVMTFRFPEELVGEIVAQSQRTGKDKTAVVVEALYQALELPLPSRTPITVKALQQQLNHLQNLVIDLSQQLAIHCQTQYERPSCVRDVLVVDDSAENLRLLSTLLRQENYEIRCAKSGEMALCSARACLPDNS